MLTMGAVGSAIAVLVLAKAAERIHERRRQAVKLALARHRPRGSDRA